MGLKTNSSCYFIDELSLPPQQQQVQVLQLQQHPTAATKSYPNDFLLNLVIFILKLFICYKYELHLKEVIRLLNILQR